MDETRFLTACREVMGKDRAQNGIGTLGEKTLHAVLKTYFDPELSHQELNVGPYVADIWNEAGFVEIQTSGFHRLRGKLELFLKTAPVTVVYPVPAVKWLFWLSEDGTISQKRKSPKNAGPWEILPELYKIKSFLREPGLRFCVILLELEEYRLKNGWSEDGKRGSTRFERLPVALLKEVWLETPMDYLQLVPDALMEDFTCSEFSKASRLSPTKAGTAVHVLHHVGALERVGKIKNAYLYRRAERPSLTAIS